MPEVSSVPSYFGLLYSAGGASFRKICLIQNPNNGGSLLVMLRQARSNVYEYELHYCTAYKLSPYKQQVMAVIYLQHLIKSQIWVSLKDYDTLCVYRKTKIKTQAKTTMAQTKFHAHFVFFVTVIWTIYTLPVGTLAGREASALANAFVLLSAHPLELLSSFSLFSELWLR